MLYNFSDIDKLKKQSKLWLIIIICTFACTIGLLVGLGFLITPKNQIWMQIILSLIFVISGWFCLYFIFNILVKNYRDTHFLSSIRRSVIQENEYKIISFNSSFTLTKQISVNEINVIKDDGVESTLYWDTSFGVIPFKEGTNVKITTGNNFILDYKIKNEKED